MNRLVHELRLLAVALQFMTRVPVPRRVGYHPDWLQQCARHFPAVGLVVGGVAAAVHVAAAAVTSPAVAAVVSTLATLVLTGAFHEDGLADTCDALGGHVDRARALAIMKDSRLGTYGTAGLVGVLALKATVLAALPVALAVPALVFGHTVSRAMAVGVMRVLPYAADPDASKARPLATSVSRRGLAVALGWAAAVGAALAAARPCWALPVAAAGGAAVVMAGACVRWFERRLGGFTGDTLGATQQLTEGVALLAWLVWLRLA